MADRAARLVLHWAGVDTAIIWSQSIEGAAQSGERAAIELVQAGL